MNKVIALVGMTGSGKTIVAEELAKKGYSFIRFGQITIDIIKHKGLEPTEKNERTIREEIRKKYGMSAYAILNLEKIERLLKKTNVVIDGLYSWSEYKVLKEKFGHHLVVIAVYSPPELRYKRLLKRERKKDDKDLRYRPASFEQAKARDYSEIENIEKGGPIAMADYTILNIGTTEELFKQLETILTDIEKKNKQKA